MILFSISHRLVFLCVAVVLLSSISLRASAQDQLIPAREEFVPQLCQERIDRQLQDERDTYRRVQFDSNYQSVLVDEPARTSQLVPYLVLNYHALNCRLRSFCLAVRRSAAAPSTGGVVLPHEPLGCSRLFAARGRWWSEERRLQGFATSVIPECAYAVLDQEEDNTVAWGPTNFVDRCDEFTEQILYEERQFLRLLTAQDAAHRGTRQVRGAFQAVLYDIRDSMLHPLRGLVDLFGRVIHPIPCLLTQCN